MKKILFIIVILLCWTTYSYATTAASCSRDDVFTAYGNTSAGGTLTIPVCNDGATWTSGITVDKAISIIGNGSSGSNKTKLIAGGNFSTGMFYVTASTTSLVRISGIYFDLNTRSTPALVLNGTMTQFQFGENYVNAGASYHIYKVGGKAHGVIHSNTFLNSTITMDLTGNNNTAWGETISAGSSNTNTLYIEGNSFIRNNDLACSPVQNHIESSQGAQYVARWNTFDGSAWCGGAYGEIDYHIMPHGDNYNDRTQRGSPLLEYYNNYSTAIRGYYWVMRGGSIVAHDNIIKATYKADGNNIFGLREEDCEYSSWTTWPAPDQIYNSFFWNNYTDDAKSTAANVFLWPGTSSSVVVADKDYFLHAPADSGGKSTLYDSGTVKYTYYDASNKMTWSASGANAYYPYTTYTCPHPLASTQGSCDVSVIGVTGYTLTGGASDTTPPTVTSFYIYGTTTVINFSENITATSGAAFTVAGLASAMTLTCPAVSSAASSITCTNSRTVYQSEGNGTYGYTGTKVSDTATSPNALATIDANPSATNMSTEVETPPAVTLTVNKTGAGCTITSSPSGVNCGSTCSADVETGTAVTISGWSENGWNAITYGGDCASDGTVTMSGAKTCTATCTQVQLLN